MNCPKCRTLALKEGKPKNSNVTIDYCSGCRGIWFDRTELEQIASEAIKDLAVPGEAVNSPRLCPRCERILYAFNYPQTFVKIDMCKKCKGLWLDGRELKEIQTVRRSLQESGKAKEYADVPGIKGKLLNLIDLAIDNLAPTSFF